MRITKIKIFLLIIIVSLLNSCATGGPVDTVQSDSQFPVVEKPKDFSSPLDHLSEFWNKAQVVGDKLQASVNLRSQAWKKYIDRLQAYDSAEAEQSAVYDELEQTGELTLLPGQSYSLELQSFCVWGGKARPVIGDGFKLAEVSGTAKEWLPDILKNLGRSGFNQERVQALIWALLEDVRFDELSEENQRLLLKFYPDAATRFGNRRLEQLGKSLFSQLTSGEVSDTLDQVNDLRNSFLSYQNDADSLRKIFAPKSNRHEPIPVGWMRTEDGYLIRVVSMEEHEAVRVDIYVPESSVRNPNSSLVFQPWRWIALPAEGQRLAISSKAIRRDKHARPDPCVKLKKYIAPSCHEPSDEDRAKIILLANPINFPLTRYQSPPKIAAAIEDETDCSSFVNEIYHRAGFAYPYASTGSFSCLSLFEKVDDSAAKPGDLVLYPGHIGILEPDGSVISATVGGRERRRATLSRDDPQFTSSIKCGS